MSYRKPAEIPDYVDDIPLGGESTPPSAMPAVKESIALWVALILISLEAAAAYFMQFQVGAFVACGALNMTVLGIARIRHLKAQAKG